MDDDALYSQTLDKIVRKLRGKYGFKRFLRDGYRTANEDHDRRYYKPAEMKVGSSLMIVFVFFFLALSLKHFSTLRMLMTKVNIEDNQIHIYIYDE